MCIAILTTSHPTYPFILISNRDEYLARPTHPAAYWPEPHANVLGGWDLERSPHGTWLGVTTQGKLCCLTNYHEADDAVKPGAKSRGIIVNSWLQSEGPAGETPEEFAARLVAADDFQGVSGFTLTYGFLRDAVRGAGPGGKGAPKGLPVLSNRTAVGAALPYVAAGKGHTVAVSNAPFGDRSWRKIRNGEALLDEAVKESVASGEGEDELVQRLLGVLRDDTMPEWDGKEPWRQYCRRMEGSIFVRRLLLQGPKSAVDRGVATPLRTESPAEKDAATTSNGTNGSQHEAYNAQSGSQLNGSAQGGYGTQKQTVILVDADGRLTYFERTLYDGEEKPVQEGLGDRKFEVQLEGWS